MAFVVPSMAGESLMWSEGMSARGVNFLENWIARNITDSDRPGSRELATILGARCRGEAASKGIGLLELELEFVTVEMAIYEEMQIEPQSGALGN